MAIAERRSVEACLCHLRAWCRYSVRSGLNPDRYQKATTEQSVVAFWFPEQNAAYTGIASGGGLCRDSRAIGFPNIPQLSGGTSRMTTYTGTRSCGGIPACFPMASVRRAISSFLESAPKAPATTLASKVMTFVPRGFPPWYTLPAPYSLA